MGSREAELASFEFDVGAFRDVQAGCRWGTRFGEEVKGEAEQGGKEQCDNQDPEISAEPLPPVEDPLPPVVVVSVLGRLSHGIRHAQLIVLRAVCGNKKARRMTTDHRP